MSNKILFFLFFLSPLILFLLVFLLICFVFVFPFLTIGYIFFLFKKKNNAPGKDHDDSLIKKLMLLRSGGK